MVLTWLTSSGFKVTHWGWGALHILLPLRYVNTFGYVTPHSWVSELWVVGFCWIYSVDSWGSESVQDFTVLFWVWFHPLSKCFGVVLMLFKKSDLYLPCAIAVMNITVLAKKEKWKPRNLKWAELLHEATWTGQAIEEELKYIFSAAWR